MKRVFSQEAVKVTACLSMLLDHIGAVFFPGSILRIVGRISFPLFCFLLSEGVTYTRNPRKYGVRLAVAALVSEVPFDLLFCGGLSWQYQNVMVTLFLGFAALQVISQKWHIVVQFVAVLGLAAAAELLHADYGAAGVLLICLFGICRGKLWLQILGMLVIFVSMGGRQIFGLAAMIPIALYSGRKATDSKALQWAFYSFYPLHLAVLWLLVAKL